MNTKPALKAAEVELAPECDTTRELTPQELEWIGGGEAVVNTI